MYKGSSGIARGIAFEFFACVGVTGNPVDP